MMLYLAAYHIGSYRANSIYLLIFQLDSNAQEEEDFDVRLLGLSSILEAVK